MLVKQQQPSVSACETAAQAGVSRSEVTKAEALVKSLTRSPTRSLAVGGPSAKDHGMWDDDLRRNASTMGYYMILLRLLSQV